MKALEVTMVGTRQPVHNLIDGQRTANPMTRTNKSTHTAEFQDFYFEHFPKMVQLATFMLGSQSLAEDAVQDCFVKLHKKWDKTEQPAGLLRKMVANRCTDKTRRLITKRKYIEKTKNELLTHKSLDTSTAIAHKDDLIRMLQAIKPKQRQVVVLKYYGGYTLADISEMLNQPEGTTRSHLRRGLEKLKELSNE